MTRDTDLIRRGDAIAWCEEQHRTWAKSHGRDPEKYVGTFTIAADILRRIPARPVQEPPSPGVTAGATGPVSDADFLRDAGMDGAKWAAGFKAIAERLGHHGMDEGWLIGWFCNAIMAGYDEAERRYRNPTPAPVVPADQRAAIEALADRMWRVHPKDIHAAGYEHLERGGKYENPRAAWYADQIEALFKQFRDQVSPVVPAEGLAAELSLTMSRYDAAAPQDDETCTGCYGSGWDGNAERFCHCLDGISARKAQEAVQEPPSPGVTAGVTGDTPIGGRVRFAVPAGRTWNDMREWLHTDPKGQSLHQHGDCLLVWANEDDLFATPAPVVPAEGLDSERLVAAWLAETEVFATRRERLMDDVLAECDLAPWLHAACQVGIDAALRAHQPAAPVSGVTVREAGWRPIETAPHEELVVLGWQENGVWKQEIALASAGERFPNGYSNMWAHGCATHWMPLPEPPAALLPAGEGEE